MLGPLVKGVKALKYLIICNYIMLARYSLQHVVVSSFGVQDNKTLDKHIGFTCTVGKLMNGSLLILCI